MATRSATGVGRSGAPNRKKSSTSAAKQRIEKRLATSKPTSSRILVLSGPNLHRLGKRQPEIYGTQTLADIHQELTKRARRRGAQVECRQSNYEGELVEWIGDASASGFNALLINPGALTHTSYALYDAVLGAEIPAVELHLSNPDAREAFRHHSCLAPACVGRIAGFGAASYLLALDGMLDYLTHGAPGP